MKKIVLVLGLIICYTTAALAQFDNIYHRFAKVEGAEAVSIGGILMKLGASMATDEDDADFIKKINSIKVIDVSDCSQAVRNDFTAAVQKLDFEGYELLMEVNDDSDNATIYIKQKGEYIRELVIASTSDDCCLVCIKGKISQDHIGELVRQSQRD